MNLVGKNIHSSILRKKILRELKFLLEYADDSPAMDRFVQSQAKVAIDSAAEKKEYCKQHPGDSKCRSFFYDAYDEWRNYFRLGAKQGKDIRAAAEYSKKY